MKYLAVRLYSYTAYALPFPVSYLGDRPLVIDREGRISHADHIGSLVVLCEGKPFDTFAEAIKAGEEARP